MALGSLFGKKAKDRSIEIDVEGMTCDHCVSHVTKALNELDGIKNVEVILNSGGLSRVTVYTDIEQDDQKLREAIAEAGYSVKDIRRDL